jgi:hypothetical protein
MFTGIDNTAVGYNAFQSDGDYNTVVGSQAMIQAGLSNQNTAIGFGSLYFNASDGNTAIGSGSLSDNTIGAYNSSLGANTLSGDFSGSVILGADAAATGDNQFVVGSATYNAGSVTAESNVSANVWNVIINGVARKILLA